MPISHSPKWDCHPFHVSPNRQSPFQEAVRTRCPLSHPSHCEMSALASTRARTGAGSPARAFAAPGIPSWGTPSFHQFIPVNLIMPTSANTFSWFLPPAPAIFLISVLEKNFAKVLTVLISIYSFVSFLSPLQWAFIPFLWNCATLGQHRPTFYQINGHLIVLILLDFS